MSGFAVIAQETAAQMIASATRQAAAEQQSRDARRALAERSWMNRAQRRAAARGEQS